MFDFENPKNPNRKPDKSYRLSENSKLAAVDFAYAGALSSRIYAQLKTLAADSCQSNTYRRFFKQLYKAVRLDRIHELGQLKIGYGSVNSLDKFRLSNKSSWQTFFRNYPIVDLDAEKQLLTLSIPAVSASELSRFPERTSKVLVKVHCIQVNIADIPVIDSLSSKDLVFDPQVGLKSSSVKFSFQAKPDVLLLCLATVRLWLFNPDGKGDFLSRNASFMTAEIVDVLLIRDGELCTFELEPDFIPLERPDSTEDELDWE